MKTIYLSSSLLVLLLTTVLLACGDPKKGKLEGHWTSKDGDKLTITGKKFSIESDAPVAEDYFVKGDTIFTSFEGNQPYTKFVIQQLDDHNLKLLYPDSISIEFSR
jgi:hypothetical protein